MRTAVAAFGPNPGFVSLQVTNEANVTNAPDAADGYYKGAEDALIDGVIAAKQQIVESGWSQVELALSTGPTRRTQAKRHSGATSLSVGASRSSQLWIGSASTRIRAPGVPRLVVAWPSLPPARWPRRWRLCATATSR